MAESGWGSSIQRRLVVSLAIAVVGLACIETAAGAIWFGWTRAPGVDLDIYLGAARRLLAGQSWFLDRQLAGPYDVEMGDILYPPVSIILFGPFLVLPRFLWWVIPIGGTIALVRAWKPEPWVWLPIAFCLAWPYTTAKVITGNPALWAMLFVALGLRWRWPAALVFLKPSVFLFGLLGVRSRVWWLTVGVLALLSAIWFTESTRWPTVILDSRGGGLLYSGVDVPMLLIPLIAWAGRRPDPQRDELAELASVRSSSDAP